MEDKKRFECSVCGKNFTSQEELANHIRMKHSEKVEQGVSNRKMTDKRREGIFAKNRAKIP
ncbi:MAG: hypothetical protein QG670_2745 [Thermoproteota archaeon]|nr:hypothetical protein [Thermoproteota archaeon]